MNNSLISIFIKGNMKSEKKSTKHVSIEKVLNEANL